jgi:hypothetical protein
MFRDTGSKTALSYVANIVYKIDTNVVKRKAFNSRLSDVPSSQMGSIKQFYWLDGY